MRITADLYGWTWTGNTPTGPNGKYSNMNFTRDNRTIAVRYGTTGNMLGAVLYIDGQETDRADRIQSLKISRWFKAER